MSPLVSILIPAYNSELWLPDAVRSALAQSYKRIEIIIVDDGSTDDTLAIARQFESPSIKVVSQENSGASAARNRAFSLAQGSYIQWLDADDILGADKIANQVRALNEVNGDRTLLSSAWDRFYFRRSKTYSMENSLWRDLTPVEWIIRKMNDNAWMAIESWLVSRELSETAGPWDTTLSADDDGEYFCRVICASDGIRFVPTARSHIRMGNLGSLSKGIHTSHQLESQFRSITSQIGNVRRLEESPRVRQACLQFLQNWLPCFYPEKKEIVAQFHTLAVELGGSLQQPRLKWKYRAYQRIFGAPAARRLSIVGPKLRVRCVATWDRWLSKMTHEDAG